MNDFEEYFVNDIVRDDSEFTFILESPHTTELQTKIPASGESGIIMSKALFGGTVSFGDLLKNNHSSVSKFSLMNASRFPLQASCYSEQLQLSNKIERFSKARKWENEKGKYNLLTHKTEIKRVLDLPLSQQIIDDFKSRFDNHLHSSKCMNFVVCGVVAQVIFENTIVTGGWYRTKKELSYHNNKINVFYENHPSDLSGETESIWLQIGEIDKLRKFLM